MPPKKLPPKMPSQQPSQQPSRPTKPSQNAPKTQNNNAPIAPSGPPAIPDYEVKQSSSMSAQLALEAAKKAYELRQAAYGAGDANAREEILAKAINKEIEAESFGKAAKYTRSGAFQGLAAGAGLGVQPGVTLGKLTGALVGGIVASVGAVAGGGIGSAYGAISGPFWDLGQMASHGVRTIVGDFPNWEATPSQKKALEKMVLGAQRTKAPDQQELEEIRDDDGGGSQEDYRQFARDLTSWIPSMPSMPSMPSLPSIPGLGGFGGQSNQNNPAPVAKKPVAATVSKQSLPTKAPTKTAAPPRPQAVPAQPPAKPQVAPPKAAGQTSKAQQPQLAAENAAKKKPKKLENRSTGTVTSQPDPRAVRKAPPKLEPRRSTATVNG